MSSEVHFVLGSDEEVQPQKELPTGVWTPWAEIKCVECVDTSHPMWKGNVAAIAELRPADQHVPA